MPIPDKLFSYPFRLFTATISADTANKFIQAKIILCLARFSIPVNSIAIGLTAVIGSILVLISTLTPAYAAEVAADITLGSSSKTTEAFAPNPLNIYAGDTVTWINKDLQPHTVTSGSDAQPDGKFDSSPGFNTLILSQETFSYTFQTEGKFPYYCALHPHMIGTVTVRTGNTNGDAGNYQPEPSLLLGGAVIFAVTLVAGYIGYTRFSRNRHRSVGGPEQLLF